MTYNPRTVQAVRELIARPPKAAPEPATEKPTPPPDPRAEAARAAMTEVSA